MIWAEPATWGPGGGAGGGAFQSSIPYLICNITFHIRNVVSNVAVSKRCDIRFSISSPSTSVHIPSASGRAYVSPRRRWSSRWKTWKGSKRLPDGREVSRQEIHGTPPPQWGEVSFDWRGSWGPSCTMVLRLRKGCRGVGHEGRTRPNILYLGGSLCVQYVPPSHCWAQVCLVQIRLFWI